MNTETSILFLGDVAPYRPYRFRNNIKAVMNLECPITTKGMPAAGKIILGARENHLRSIFGSGLLCVNLGNNHILDYGKEGLDSTLAELEKEGISYFGLNRKGNNPFVINFNDYKIAFISAVCKSTSPVLDYNKTNILSPLEPAHIIRKIQSVRKLADRIVVYLHHGEEDSSLPALKDIKIARALIDGGADIVIGSHAHSPQAVEKYKYGIIAYNLGNFIMPEMKELPSYFDETGTPRAVFSSRIMLWNRISWGVVIDMVTMRYKIRKYIFTKKRILELPFTPYDMYLKLPEDTSRRYTGRVERHLRMRNLQRKLVEFIYNPHVPQLLKRKS